MIRLNTHLHRDLHRRPWHLFSPMTLAGLTVSFLAERCFQVQHHNHPVMNQILLWKYSLTQRKCVSAELKMARTSHWLHTCHRSTLLIVTFGQLKLFVIRFFFFSAVFTMCPLVPVVMIAVFVVNAVLLINDYREREKKLLFISWTACAFSEVLK